VRLQPLGHPSANSVVFRHTHRLKDARNRADARHINSAPFANSLVLKRTHLLKDARDRYEAGAL